MPRVLIAITILAFWYNAARSNNPQYPPLTRETLIGSWEGVIGIGTAPVVFHIVIAARDSDSYLSEIYPDSMKGRLFHLESCSVADGKVTLHFTEPGGGPSYWIVGEGYGDRDRAWIHGRIGLPNKPEPGPTTFYLERSSWVRDLGQAAVRAAEKIPK
jgi:hypothetical protein